MLEGLTFTKLFGLILAVGALATSVAMVTLGGRWQKIEAAAYGGERRPLWFWACSALVIALYLAALVDFVGGDKTWAGWALIVVMPAGWAIKAAAVIFNSRGRQAVSAISGDQAWTKVGLARAPIAIILAALAAFA